jgi:hypothetical protein
MDDGNGRGSSLDALRHPLRVRIIEICTEFGPISPTEIVNRGLCSDVPSLKGKTPRQQLSNLSYHCRELEQAGLLMLDREQAVRGATEHFYSANVEAFFSDEEWAALDREDREEISQVMWHRFVAQVESAVAGGTFDSRVDRMLAWGPLLLDEKGWKELTSYLAESYWEIERIKRDAEGRLSEPGAVLIKSNYGLFCFESPHLREKS